jgi:putative intracellular protease/amidase
MMSTEDHDAVVRLVDKVDGLVKRFDTFLLTGGVRCAVQEEKLSQLAAHVKWMFGLVGSVCAYLAYKWAEGK